MNDDDLLAHETLLEGWRDRRTVLRYGRSPAVWQLTAVGPCFGDRDCVPGDQCVGVVTLVQQDGPWRMHDIHLNPDDLGEAS